MVAVTASFILFPFSLPDDVQCCCSLSIDD